MISPLSQQKIVRMETQAMFPYLIEITTPDNNVYRYCNSDSDIVFNDNGVSKTFNSAYFKLTPPEKTETGIKDAKITMSAIDQTWIEKIRKYDERSTIRFVAIIEDDGYIEAIDDITFKLTNVSWNETTIQWTMKFDDWLDIMMPVGKLTQFVAPALF